jgi:hypothetical protein
MSVAATRSRPGASVDFTITASVVQGRGCYDYQLTYGDGTTDHNGGEHVCPALEGSGALTLHLTHRYQAPGRYAPFVHVSVTSIAEQVTSAPVTIVIA